MVDIPPILEVGGVLISSDILTERFCCDLSKCKGICCVEGDAGAPVTIDEIAAIEESLDAVWPLLSASAQSVIDRQGVAYTDEEGDLVTSIVHGKDCVFTYYGEIEDWETRQHISDCCLCALEKVCREGGSHFQKPVSCALYPIRVKEFPADRCNDGGDVIVALNYNRWHVCDSAREKGRELDLPLYRFLEGPLVRRFGQAWYDELCDVAHELLCESTED